MATSRRALHFVLRVGGRDRKGAMDFYRKTLGMKVLRHEEFEDGCAASCNGPYDNRWSKTMVGYGPEDDHFVLELTYNYSVADYILGNDLRGIRLSKGSLPPTDKKDGSNKVLLSPDGYYAFEASDNDHSSKEEKVIIGVELSVTDLEKSLAFWRDILGMNTLMIGGVDTPKADLRYGPNQAKVTLVQLDKDGPSLDRGTAFGRLAFSLPTAELEGLEAQVKAAGYTVLTPRVELATPGKADVVVVILADPDGHEICFVGDEGFRQLSQVDPEAERILDAAIEADKSNEWFSKRGRDKGNSTSA